MFSKAITRGKKWENTTAKQIISPKTHTVNWAQNEIKKKCVWIQFIQRLH